MSTALALMLAQPPAWGENEPVGARYERLGVIEAASAIEATKADPAKWRFTALAMQATLLVTSYEEGWRWSLAVHAGEKTGDAGRARCLTQLHQHPTWVPGPMWRATTGTDLEATQLCMRGAVRVLEHYSATCVSPWRAANDVEGSLARVIAGYGSGKSCSVAGRPWAVKRAKRVVRWLRELEAA